MNIFWCSVIHTHINCAVSITDHPDNSSYIYLFATLSCFPLYCICMFSKKSELKLEHLIQSTVQPYDVTSAEFETAQESTHCRMVSAM